MKFNHKALFAALSLSLGLSQSACTENDEYSACYTPIAVEILTDLNSVHTDVNINNYTNLNLASSQCNAFASELKFIVDKQLGVTVADIQNDFEQVKDTDIMCGLSKTLYTALLALDFSQKYSDIKDIATYCLVEKVAETVIRPESLAESMKTLEGWHEILSKAAEAAAKESHHHDDDD